jgi:hypothetical protein
LQSQKEEGVTQRRARGFFATPIPTEDTNEREQQNEVKVVFLPQCTEHDPQPIMINERNEGVDNNDVSFVTAAEDMMGTRMIAVSQMKISSMISRMRRSLME